MNRFTKYKSISLSDILSPEDLPLLRKAPKSLQSTQRDLDKNAESVLKYRSDYGWSERE